MYDAKKIIVGLVIFAALVSLPFWFRAARGDVGPPPEVELPENERRCVEPKAFMTQAHMVLLNEWRDAVVREGTREYVSKAYGTHHEMSLTRTCMGCHTSKAAFCDRCHEYAAVDVYCWDCHVEPNEAP